MGLGAVAELGEGWDARDSESKVGLIGGGEEDGEEGVAGAGSSHEGAILVKSQRASDRVGSSVPVSEV